jgi:hypothetical protein
VGASQNIANLQDIAERAHETASSGPEPKCTCEVWTQDDRTCPKHQGSLYRRRAERHCEFAASEIPDFGTDRDKHRCPKLHRDKPLKVEAGAASSGTPATAIITDRERELMEHALGPANKPRFRNYYCCTVGGTDYHDWLLLAKLGLARKSHLINDEQDAIFNVTPEGEQAVGRPPDMTPSRPKELGRCASWCGTPREFVTAAVTYGCGTDLVYCARACRDAQRSLHPATLPKESGVCASWCGTVNPNRGKYWQADGDKREWCSEACMLAGRSLHPAPGTAR